MSTPAPSESPVVPTTGPNVRPGEKPPVLPAIANEDNAAGALTFADYWVQALDWGYATTDSTLAREWFSKSCSDCELFMQNFDVPQRKGEHLKGGRLSVLSTALVANDRRNGAQRAVDVAISAQELKVVRADGKVVSASPAVTKVVFRFWLRRSQDRWLVVQKGLVS